MLVIVAGFARLWCFAITTFLKHLIKVLNSYSRSSGDLGGFANLDEDYYRRQRSPTSRLIAAHLWSALLMQNDRFLAFRPPFGPLGQYRSVFYLECLTLPRRRICNGSSLTAKTSLRNATLGTVSETLVAYFLPQAHTNDAPFRNYQGPLPVPCPLPLGDP